MRPREAQCCWQPTEPWRASAWTEGSPTSRMSSCPSKKRTETTTPFDASSMRSLVIYQAAQRAHISPVCKSLVVAVELFHGLFLTVSLTRILQVIPRKWSSKQREEVRRQHKDQTWARACQSLESTLILLRHIYCGKAPVSKCHFTPSSCYCLLPHINM